jgi:hypothetical protein
MLNYITNIVNKFTEHKGPKSHPCGSTEKISKGNENVLRRWPIRKATVSPGCVIVRQHTSTEFVR